MLCRSGGETSRGMSIGEALGARIAAESASTPLDPVLLEGESGVRADNRGERRTRVLDVRLGLLRGVPEPPPLLRGASQTVASEASDDPKSSLTAGLSGPCKSAWKCAGANLALLLEAESGLFSLGVLDPPSALRRLFAGLSREPTEGECGRLFGREWLGVA